MRNIISFLLVVSCTIAQSQNSISFLNKNFKTTGKKNAVYQMEQTQNGDTIHQIVFGINSSTIIAEFSYHINYADYKYQKKNYSNGMPIEEGAYYKGKKTGEWKYYSDWGLVMVSKNYIDNVENGIRKNYSIEGTLIKESYISNGRQNGLYKSYHFNGQLMTSGKMINSLEDGRFVYYSDSGIIRFISNYKNGKLEGPDTIFKQGNIYKVYHYINGIRQGEFSIYKDQKIIHSGSYKNDTIQTSNVKLDSSQLREFGYLNAVNNQKMPMFPGGESLMMRFIVENVSYPVEAIFNNIEGEVRVKFTVVKDGSIKDIHLLTEPMGYGCDKAAYEVIKMMPRWEPGLENGVPVNVYFNLPIRFRLF